jgi:hypothetical protein
MRQVRLVDLRAVLEAACGLALLLALLMPLFTTSSGSLVPIQVQTATTVVDAFPRDPFADAYVLITSLALGVALLRVFRPGAGLILLSASLATFGAALGLIVFMQLQWSDATSSWQADAARFLGVKFSQSFGFWVYLVAAAIGVVVAFAELMLRLGRGGGSQLLESSGLLPGSSASTPVGAWGIRGGRNSLAVATRGAPVDSGRVIVAEAGRSREIAVHVGDCLVFGRESGCDVPLADPRASRRHMSLERSPEGWIVRDLGATNPTRAVLSGGVTRETGAVLRIRSGQLLVGDVLVTLLP